MSAVAIAVQPETQVVREMLGAGAGPEHTEHQYFFAGMTDGGGCETLTPTSASYTLTAALLDGANCFTFVASSTMPALTFTLPATSTMPNIVPRVGDTRSWIIENPFTAAATTTTFAAGTGVDLQEPSGQDVVIGINNFAYLTCTRFANASSRPGDVVCRVDETVPAD